MTIRQLLLVITTSLFAVSVSADSTEASRDADNATMDEEETAEQTNEQEPPPPPAYDAEPNLVGPDGATGVIRRSDRRQDRREGNPRVPR